MRTLRLGTPLQIGPLAITELGVRTSDFGNASAIREEGGDPDEIVVTADRRRDPDRDRIVDRRRSARPLLLDRLRQGRPADPPDLRLSAVQAASLSPSSAGEDGTPSSGAVIVTGEGPG